MSIDKIDQYYQLCQDFDKVLTHKKSNAVIVASTYLHILRAHPEILQHYQTQTLWNRTLIRLRYTIVWFVRILQSIANRQHYYTQHNIKNADVLIVSHLDSRKQIGKNPDLHFGELSDQLLDNNIHSNIVSLNHVELKNSKDLKLWKNNKTSRIILSRTLSLIEEIKIYRIQRLAKKQLKIILNKSVLSEKIKSSIMMHYFSSTNALRVAKQISELAKETQAKCVITTYEGHSWERLVYFLVRQINPKIKCFGYQQAAVFEHQYPLKRSLRKEYNPDFILTSGKISCDILSNCESLKGVVIACIGSKKYRPAQSIDVRLRACLVVPEGFISECLVLFELSAHCAKQHKDQKFIWRLHPMQSFDKLKKHSSIFKNLPDNIVLSEGSLEEDIKKCDSVLYRGSTAVVSAINSGLKPIYYQQSNNELSIDPIYTHQIGKFIARNQKELSLALNEEIDMETKQSLKDFAQDFYTPLDVKFLLKEIEG